MKLTKKIGILSIIFVALSIAGGITMFLQEDFHAQLFKLTTFLFYTSILLCGNFILNYYNTKISDRVIVLITFFNFGLIIFSGLILFDIIPFSKYWHIIIGISILYFLSIQLNLLGWSTNKHSLLNKIVFLIVLLCNIFLASVFLFKLENFEFKPFILIAIIISVIFLFIGVYNSSKKI